MRVKLKSLPGGQADPKKMDSSVTSRGEAYSYLVVIELSSVSD